MSGEAVIQPTRRIVSTLASLLLFSGCGHLGLGRYRRGAVWIAARLCAVLLLILSVFSHSRLLFVVCFVLALALTIGATIDTYRIAPAARVPGWPQTIFLWILLAILGEWGQESLSTHVLASYRFPSASMAPTILMGDRVYCTKHDPQHGRGQLVLYRGAQDPTQRHIKRVVAIAGDTVKVCGGQLIVNGKPVRRQQVDTPCEYESESDAEPGTGGTHVRPCVAYREWAADSEFTTAHNNPTTALLSARCTDETAVPPGHVFLLGDNRDNSHDSRYWGTLPVDHIEGNPWFVSRSSDRAGLRFDRLGLLLR